MNTVDKDRVDELAQLMEKAQFSPQSRAVMDALVRLIAHFAYSPIREGRRLVRRALQEDPELQAVYRDNIACWIMDFDATRHIEPNTIPGPMSKSQRDQLAGIILKNLFDL